MGDPQVEQHLRTISKKKPPASIANGLMQPGTPLAQSAGKSPRSLLQPAPIVVCMHPFGSTLKDWKAGVTVDCGPDWPPATIQQAINQGPNPSALTPESLELFQEDIAYQVQAGFSEVVLLEQLMKDPPANLKFSPVAVVPQANRRGRIILNLSFPIRSKTTNPRRAGKIVQPSVNESTIQTAPSTPVKLIGVVLFEMFEYMAAAPPNVDILLSKVDLSDGFWRMTVHAHDCYNFCYILPQPPSESTRVVIPSALQMGWQESPAYFCTATETGRDLINWMIEEDFQLSPHPFEQFVLPNQRLCKQPTTSPNLLMRPWKAAIYVDDFINNNNNS